MCVWPPSQEKPAFHPRAFLCTWATLVRVLEVALSHGPHFHSSVWRLLPRGCANAWLLLSQKLPRSGAVPSNCPHHHHHRACVFRWAERPLPRGQPASTREGEAGLSLALASWQVPSWVGSSECQGAPSQWGLWAASPVGSVALQPCGAEPGIPSSLLKKLEPCWVLAPSLTHSPTPVQGKVAQSWMDAPVGSPGLPGVCARTPPQMGAAGQGNGWVIMLTNLLKISFFHYHPLHPSLAPSFTLFPKYIDTKVIHTYI